MFIGLGAFQNEHLSAWIRKSSSLHVEVSEQQPFTLKSSICKSSWICCLRNVHHWNKQNCKVTKYFLGLKGVDFWTAKVEIEPSPLSLVSYAMWICFAVEDTCKFSCFHHAICNYLYLICDLNTWDDAFLNYLTHSKPFHFHLAKLNWCDVFRQSQNIMIQFQPNLPSKSGYWISDTCHNI